MVSFIRKEEVRLNLRIRVRVRLFLLLLLPVKDWTLTERCKSCSDVC